MNNDAWFMVIDDSKAYGMYGGIAYAIFETRAEALRYQLARGLSAKTKIVRA